MSSTQRNFLILGLIAFAALFVSDAFAVGAGELSALISLAFTVLLVWFLVILYYRNSGTIALMATTPRLVMQGACAALFFLLAVGTMPQILPLVHVPMPYPVGFSRFGGGWTLLFWGGIFACGFGVWWSWQQRTSKW